MSAEVTTALGFGDFMFVYIAGAILVLALCAYNLRKPKKKDV